MNIPYTPHVKIPACEDLWVKFRTKAFTRPPMRIPMLGDGGSTPIMWVQGDRFYRRWGWVVTVDGKRVGRRGLPFELGVEYAHHAHPTRWLWRCWQVRAWVIRLLIRVRDWL